MKKMKVGLVGLGWFGRKHLNAWQCIPNAEVAAVADINIHAITSDKPHSSQSNFHVDDADKMTFTGNKYESLELLIKNENVDIIDIVTPPETHYELAMQCIGAGINVLIEKPFTLNYKHTYDIIQYASAKKVLVFSSHILRFDKRIQYIKDIIGRGELGKIVYGSFKRNFQVSGHYVYGNIHPLYSACIHDIDLLIWLSGSQVKKTIGIQKHFLNRPYPDLVSIILEMENGSVFHVENVWHIANSCPSGFENSISLYGEKANCFQKNEPVIELWSDNKVSYPEMFFWPSIDGQVGGALKSMLSHYTSCCLDGRHSEILPPGEILETLRTIEMIEKHITANG